MLPKDVSFIDSMIEYAYDFLVDMSIGISGTALVLLVNYYLVASIFSWALFTVTLVFLLFYFIFKYYKSTKFASRLSELPQRVTALEMKLQGGNS